MAHSSTTLSSPTQDLVAKDFSNLIGMEGFSEKMLTQHFSLYQAYVKNTNLLFKKWNEFRSKGDFSDPAFGETKRRFGWEYNSVKLHELYFGNLGKEKSSPENSNFKEAVTDQFGSFDTWRDEFLGTGGTRGIGWVVVYRDESTGRIVNAWIDEHNNGHLIQSEPILVLDVFEHAFITDYGIDKKKYMAAFMNNVQWEEVDRRLAEGI